MKKTYINPDTSVILVMAQSMVCTSVDGFDKDLDNDNPIDPGDMLSRRHNDVWEDDLDDEEEDY